MKQTNKQLLERILYECIAVSVGLLIVYLSIFSADLRLLTIWSYSFFITFILLTLFNSIIDNPYLDDIRFNISLSILGPLTLITITSTFVIYTIKAYKNEKHEKSNSKEKD